MTYEYKQYLSHHDIKGQKRENRKCQNEDGTLTEEGKYKKKKEKLIGRLGGRALSSLK